MCLSLLHAVVIILQLLEFAVSENILQNIEVFSGDLEGFFRAKIHIFFNAFDDDCLLASSKGTISTSTIDDFELFLYFVQGIDPGIWVRYFNFFISDWKKDLWLVFMTQAILPHMDNMRIYRPRLTKNILIYDLTLAEYRIVESEVRVFELTWFVFRVLWIRRYAK